MGRSRSFWGRRAYRNGLYAGGATKGLPPDTVDKLSQHHAHEQSASSWGLHPGEIIKPAGLSVTDSAKALGVSRPALSSLLNAKAALSRDLALRIEKAFGVKMDTLMRMQAAYDIARTRKREKEIHVRWVRCEADVHAQGLKRVTTRARLL